MARKNVFIGEARNVWSACHISPVLVSCQASLISLAIAGKPSTCSRERIDPWLAESRGECQVLFVAEILISKKHDAELVHGGADFIIHASIVGLRRIHTEYLCTAMGGQRSNIQVRGRRGQSPADPRESRPSPGCARHTRCQAQPHGSYLAWRPRPGRAPASPRKWVTTS